MGNADPTLQNWKTLHLNVPLLLPGWACGLMQNNRAILPSSQGGEGRHDKCQQYSDAPRTCSGHEGIGVVGWEEELGRMRGMEEPPRVPPPHCLLSFIVSAPSLFRQLELFWLG